MIKKYQTDDVNHVCRNPAGYHVGTNTGLIRVCLAQFNFTSKTVFLENSFMSNFLDEAELF